MTAVYTSHLEQLSETFAREWLHEERVVVYHIHTTNLKPHDIDLYVNTVIDTMNQWDRSKPYLALQLLQNISITDIHPHIRQRANDLLEAVDPLTSGKVATVLSPNPFYKIARLWLERDAYHKQPNLEHHLFFQRQPAQNWLTKSLAPTF